jgi:alpha-L-fucosidase
VEAVYSSKRPEDCAGGTCVLDVERGIVDKIWPDPWQTDTCIGNWHYKRGITYKTPKTVIDMLADIVSRNGNMLLNFPLPNSGGFDPEELKVLSGITDWMAVNSEGIYGTRPWKICGEGPSTETKGDAKFNERNRRDLTPKDIRFTTKGNTLYAFVMGWPEKEATIPSLARTPIRNVELLGHKAKVTWTQTEAGLNVQMPSEKPSDHAITLKITLA